MMTTTGIHLPETLKFVASDEDFSTYRTTEGEEVYLAHGTGKRLVPFTDLDVNTLWREFAMEPLRPVPIAGNGNDGILLNDPWARRQGPSAWPEGGARAALFLDYLRGLTCDVEMVDEEVGICSDCHVPGYRDEMRGTRNGGDVCETCICNYTYCDSCEEADRSSNWTVYDTSVCDSCRVSYWSWCDYCEGYFRDGNAEEHYHDDDDDDRCSCEAPGQSFSIRNDGDEPLANDTRATVTLPAGVISAEGLAQIGWYLRDYAWALDLDGGTDEAAAIEQSRLLHLRNRLSELGDKWQTKEGNYTKRLSRFAYKEFSLKLKPEVVSKVGCIARDNSTAVDFAIEVTRNLNLSAYDFGHEDSCWWQSYTSSRCTLKSNGGFGMRTFAEATSTWSGDTYEQVNGRAWVMPLKYTEGEYRPFTPTFETLDPDAFMVFNGYGDLGGYAPARILSHMAGMTYRKVSFACDPMYINAGGYLVAPEEIADKFTDSAVFLSTEIHSDLFHIENAANAEKKVLAHV